jgi:lysozyme family protein
MSFADCLPVILESEGGYVVDQGGPTNFGITIPALQAWLHRPCTADDIQALTEDGPIVGALYEADYYNAASCNVLPDGLDLMVFDEAVNEGVGRAIRHLQASLGVAVDGAFGPITQAAVAACNVAQAIQAIHDTNAAYYVSLDETYPQDEAGWAARNDRTCAAALAMVGE